MSLLLNVAAKEAEKKGEQKQVFLVFYSTIYFQLQLSQYDFKPPEDKGITQITFNY